MSRVSIACASVLALAGVTGAAQAQAQVADRYGPAAPAYDPAPSPSAALAGAPMHMLSWPGKVTPHAETMADAPAPAPQAPALQAPVQQAARAPMRDPAPHRVQIASAAVAPSPSPYRARYVAPVEQAPSPPMAPPTASSASPHYGLVQAYPSPTRYDDAPTRPTAPVRAQAIAAPPAVQAPFRSTPQAQNLQAQNLQAQSPQAPIVQAPIAQAKTARAAQAAPTPQVVSPDPAHPGWAPPRRPWSQAGDTGVRFYSLHRQYGVKPDPAPLPPQFFTATADMGEPSGPMTRTLSGAGSVAQAARAVQAAQAETSSDVTSGQP